MADNILRRIDEAIDSGDAAGVRQLLTEHPECKDRAEGEFFWLHQAAGAGHRKVIDALLELGYDVNHTRYPEEATPLNSAIHKSHCEVVGYLLSRGADPNLGRPLISAINSHSEETGLALVQLLVEHGADVNRVFPWFGDDKVAFSPLSWAVANGKSEIASYLRSKGAIESNTVPPAQKNLSQEVVAYFEEHFGPVRPQALIEIVPDDPAIAIHVVPASKGEKHITLFTTGMSNEAMAVPEGNDLYRFAELFIQLPADWPLTEKKQGDSRYGWPLTWLRSTAKYPHQNKTWLGGPVTIIANGDPPEPLAPNVDFTCILLLAERHFVSADGGTIQLYRLSPLYTEERNLELSEGIPALMRAFDRHDVPFVVDLKRRNVAKE